MKKNLTTVIILACIEFILLLSLFLIAVSKTNGINKVTSDITLKKISQTYDSFYDLLCPSSSSQQPTATPTPAKEDKYKIYSFSFQKNNYTYEYQYSEIKDTSLNGLVSYTEDKSKYTISKANSDYKLGALEVTNRYVYVPLDLTDIFNEPLILNTKTKVLVYHVHTSEGYCKTESDKTDIKHTTTDDPMNNVISAGEALTGSLAEFNVLSYVHNKTVHDEGYNHNIAYSLGQSTALSVLAEDNDIHLTIDIHRDGIDVTHSKYGPTVTSSGQTYALISFVIGLDYDDNGNRNEANNPYWKENFKLSALIISELEKRVPGISRGIMLRRTPYNTNLTDNSLLVEIGFDGNLTSEAAATAKLLGEVLSEIYK